MNASTEFSSLRIFKIMRGWPTLLLLALGTVISEGCKRAATPQGEDAAKAGPIEVDVVTMKTQSVPVSKELPGRTAAYRLAEVRARVNGVVLKRMFEEGADVKEGQQLYQIDPAPYEAELTNARAAVARAEASVKVAQLQERRLAELAAANAIARQDYDNALATLHTNEADLASAKASVQSATINLNYTKVFSPISGRIGRSEVTEGAYVQQAQASLLATVRQLDPIYVDMTDSSVEVLRIKNAMTRGELASSDSGVQVSLFLEDGRLYGEKGKLEFLEAAVEPTTGSVGLRALVPNPRKELLPGMFVRARLEGVSRPDAILVPQGALARNPKGEPYVMVVVAGEKVEERPIQIGQSIGNQWLVDSGLKAGDRVIVAGLQKIRPGSTVKAVPVNPPEKSK